MHETEQSIGAPLLSGPNVALLGTSLDAALLIRVQQHDEDALVRLYERYARLVYTVALRITQNRMIAEEVLQDVFQNVWMTARGFDSNRSAYGWLVAIARHRAIDTTRSHLFRKQKQEIRFNDAPLSFSQAGLEELLTRLSLQDTLQDALGKLTLAQRYVIVSAYFGSLTCQEIAEQLGVPIGTVKSRLRSGRLQLRQLLKDSDV